MGSRASGSGWTGSSEMIDLAPISKLGTSPGSRDPASGTPRRTGYCWTACNRAGSGWTPPRTPGRTALSYGCGRAGSGRSRAPGSGTPRSTRLQTRWPTCRVHDWVLGSGSCLSNMVTGSADNY